MRKSVSSQLQAQVLIRCRRRCAVCFGLTRDTSIRKGQIAHLDKDSSNSAIDNLVFLCFDHHDQYDSTTRQSKNLTQAEVRHYRDELEKQIDAVWKEPAQFEITPLLDLTGISGHYLWETGNASAELDINVLGNNIVSVAGFALWGTQNPYGPNIGQLDFKGTLLGDVLHYKYPDSEYAMKMLFTPDGITVEEENVQGQFGMNVTFAGDFIRSAQTTQDQSIPETDLTISLRDGNIFCLQGGKEEKQLTFCRSDESPIPLAGGKILFIRREEGFAPSIDPSMGHHTYYSHRIMTVDMSSLFERTVTDTKPYEDGLDGSTQILRVGNPALSLDGKYLYFVTEKYATASQLVKVEIETGRWIELFTAESFELIRSGLYQNMLLVAQSEIRNRGRDIYYKLCDQSGKVHKEFDSVESLMQLRDSLG
jgi:hypothetical protein